MKLLASQKQQLFDAILGSGTGFHPSQFEIKSATNKAGEERTEILFKGSEFGFAIIAAENGPIVGFSPGRETFVETEYYADWGNLIYQQFPRWLQYLERETSASDPWEELERQATSFNAKMDYDATNEPFTAKEFKEVKNALAVIQALMITFAQENEVAHIAIRSGIQNLESKAESMGRKDWFLMATGFILSTATSMALAPEQTRSLFNALKNGLERAIHFLSN